MSRQPSSGIDLAALRLRASDLLHTRRRAISACLAAVGVVCAISAMRPGPAASSTVWVASHDLPGGAPLKRTDLRLEPLPRAAVPTGALPTDRSPAGEVLAAPVRTGEPLTDVRVISPALLATTGSALNVAVPVRVTDGPAALALVKAGQRIAVIATGDPGTSAAARTRTVVEDVRVLAVPTQLGVDDAGLIIVAVSPHQAATLAAIPAGDRVSVAVRH